MRDFGSLKVGYANEQYDREGRGFSDVSENIFRLAYDANLFERASVRVLFDTGQRRGDGYIISGVDYESGPAGTQPGLRYFDEADRDRTKASVVFSVNPVPRASAYVQYSTTRDEFLGRRVDSGGPRVLRPSDAGHRRRRRRRRLQRHRHGVVRRQRTDATSSARSRSRVTPTRRPIPTWTDPSRNWTLDNNEVVNTFISYLDLSGLAQSKADVRFSYERNDSDNAFTYGGPRIPALQAAGQFIPLPNVVNEWNRFTIDVKYFCHAEASASALATGSRS